MPRNDFKNCGLTCSIWTHQANLISRAHKKTCARVKNPVAKTFGSITNIDHLKEGIGLRGVGQKNPLIEYKKEAFIMFTDMMRSITTDVVGHIFHLDPTRFNSAALQARREQEMQNMQFSGASEDEAGGAVIKNKK